LTSRIRLQSSELVLRGKRLVLQYTNGSPCGEAKYLKRDPSWKENDDEDEHDDDNKPSTGKGVRRKSATISFHCDKDPLATGAIASFASVDPDECAYFFEVLSPTACGGAAPAKEGLGPASVFAIIGVIAVLVYFLGGVVYQRNVAHARGWRQLPNFTMWAGIWNFITVSRRDS
jgi:cation-dependent mannose-6-phosphate receptor